MHSKNKAMDELNGRVEALETVLGELLIALRENESRIAADLKKRLELQLKDDSHSVVGHNAILNKLVLL